MKRMTIFLAMLLIASMLLCACSQEQGLGASTGETTGQTTDMTDEVPNEETALVPKPMAPNAVTRNPYMADSDNSVHNDSYSSDVTDAVLPLGIDSFLAASLETQNKVSSPSAAHFQEDRGH